MTWITHAWIAACAFFLRGGDLGTMGGAAMATSAITYLANERQLVTMAAGHALFTFEISGQWSVISV